MACWKAIAISTSFSQDYWERFQECLATLRDRRQRTVYRLTLVKGARQLGYRK